MVLAVRPRWDTVAFWSRRKRAGEALAYLAAIVESSDDAILSKNLDGIIQSCNSSAERIFGYSAAELVGRPITMLIPPDRQGEEMRILERLRRGERIDHYETVRIAKDGHPIHVSLTISPIRDASGAIVGASKIARDISERKQTEQALRRAQQMARFMANASLALADLSDERTILQRVASLSVPFFADWCTADIVGDGVLERVAVAHSEPGKAGLAHEIAGRWLPGINDSMGPGWVAASGKSEIVEDIGQAPFSWVREEGHRRVLHELGFASYLCVPVMIRARGACAVLTFATGRPERRYDSMDLRVAEDLAHRTAVALENAMLYRGAVEADHRKDDFLAVLSHELRTPLNAIVGWSHVLREGTASLEMVRQAAETIHRNAQVQARLISDILDISRIAAGKIRLDLQAVDLPAVVEAALESLRPAANAKGVRLETAFDPEAGPVSGDPSRLQQIVWNLVCNAIKFVPEGRGRVRASLEAQGPHVRLTVEDNGPGIDSAFLPHVFDRFRQAESGANRRSQGLGLGLAIVRQLVELHGGTVQAANCPDGLGACFTVQLPCRGEARATTATEADERAQVEQPLWLDAAPGLGGVRVLVVDDREDARDLLKYVLERCGATVVVAASAAEALVIVPRDKPDVLLSDVEMPEQSGYDLLRRLRSLPAAEGGQTPAVALTAYASAHDRVQLLRAGFQMHVPKPVQPAELATVVASLAKKDG